MNFVSQSVKHRMLLRQLKKLNLEQTTAPDDASWQVFLDLISSSYNASDQDRYTLERSLTISSEEMQLLYQQQKQSYENRLQAIFNALPDVLFLITEEGECIEVMSSNKRLLHDNRNMALGKFIHEVYDKEQSKFFYDGIQQAISSQQLVVLNYQLPINNNNHYFEGRIMPSRYDYHGKQTVVFIATDITKKVSAEHQGRLLSTVFEKSREGMLVLDKELKLVTVNKAFCELNNLTMDTVDDALPGIIMQFFNLEKSKQIKQALKTDGYWIGEIGGRDRQGHSYPLWLTINTVNDMHNRLSNYIIMLTDVSEIKRSQEELEHVATHDSLTNLPNRVLFNDRLNQAVYRSKRSGKLGALFFLDLDRFKNVNDNLGHQIGDELLVQVSNRLLGICRSSDTLARLGGDEFTLIIEGMDHTEEPAMIAEKILAEFIEPFKLGGYKLEVSTSIGISVFPRDSDDPVEIIKQADTAMYSAKELGRNTYQFYTQELTSNAFEYFAIEIALRKALQRDQFFLLYQPQYDLKSGEMIGVEALIRWQHPDMGIVSPAQFIPIAETTGQIQSIGEWVITESCRQCALWKSLGLENLIVSINLSRKQLIIPTLSKQVADILSEQGVAGEQIEFEITESSILDNKDIVYDNLTQFKAMGVSMAIDDFGTGYSSLINLKQFPLSRLKIDQSFVRDVTKDKNDEAIIRATIALGKSLNLDIIAEGVEKEEQRDFLIKEGCDQVQGYLYSEPLLADDITAILLDNDGQRKSSRR